MTEQVGVQEVVEQSDLQLSREEAASTPTMTSIDEARRYRRRAQQAEKSVAELRDQVAERDKTLAVRDKSLAEHEQTIASLQRRQAVDDLLLEADAIDLEAARVLTEAAMALMDKPDVEAAVQELRRRKPYLFRQMKPKRDAAGVSSPKQADESLPAVRAQTEAATQAGASGKRSDLLRYLRLRRRA